MLAKPIFNTNVTSVVTTTLVHQEWMKPPTIIGTKPPMKTQGTDVAHLPMVGQNFAQILLNQCNLFLITIKSVLNLLHNDRPWRACYRKKKKAGNEDAELAA